MDSLQWEIHRLGVENRHLREENPEVSRTLQQLEGAKREVAELTDRKSELERRLTETARAAEDAAERAQRAETRAEELETRRLGERTDGHGGEAEASLEIERLRADNERSLREVQQELAEQGTRLGEEERRNHAAREDLLLRTELERYRALDEQRQKWEARETRLIARLEAVEEELGALGDSTSRAADNEHLKEQLRSLASDLQAVQSLVSSLTEQNRELAREKKWLDLENRQVQESPGLAGCRQNQGEPVLAGCRQNQGEPVLAGCRQNQGEPVLARCRQNQGEPVAVLSGGMDGVCETHTRHETSGLRREQEEQQESCARRDLVTGGPSDSVLVPPCEISWRESRAGLESQAAPRSEALAVPVVGNGDGGRRSWERDGDSERGNIGASVPQPHLGTIPPWPPPGGAELMGRVTTAPCLGTGVRSDQWGGDRGQQNNECLPQLAELPDQMVSQVPITPTPYPPQPQVQGGHLEASLWLPQQRGVVRNTMGSHPVHTPPVGRVGQEYPILQAHSNSRMEGSEKGTPLSSGSAGGAVSEQLESDNQLQPDSNNEGVHPTSTLSRESNSAMGQGVRDSASSQPALGRDKEGDSGDTLSDTSSPTENGSSPSGSSGSEGVVAWKEKERRASREGTKVAGVDACVIVCLAECA